MTPLAGTEEAPAGGVLMGLLETLESEAERLRESAPSDTELLRRLAAATDDDDALW